MPTVLRNENTAKTNENQAWTTSRILQSLRTLSVVFLIIIIGFALFLAWQIESPMLTPLLTAGSIIGLLAVRSIIFRTK